MSGRADRRPPDARLIFATGDYSHALGYYAIAKNLMLEWGLCFASDVAGVINSPRHPQWPEPHDSCVPTHLLDDPNWEASIDLWFDNPRRVAWLRGQQLPDGLRLEIKEEGK
jgi:hypothetical protein